MRKPRLRLRRRLTPAGLLAAALLAVLVAADHGGLLGRRGDDFSRYDGKEFTVVRDVDGDTFAIDVPDADSPTTTIRLWGVDTPETRKPNAPVQHFGPEAAEFTRRLTLHQRVRVQLVSGKSSRDRYKRLLAYVFLPDGRMLNRLLVQTGHAYADPRYDHPLKSEFAAEMKRARREGLGLWAGVQDRDLPYYLSRELNAPSAAP